MDKIDRDYIERQSFYVELMNGGRQMINGMKYHYDNFARLYSEFLEMDVHGETVRLQHWKFVCGDNPMKHEVTAYINRMGQFYYFVNSDIVKAILGDDTLSSIPTIQRLILFRHNQTAHRATDVNKKWKMNMRILNQQFSLYDRYVDHRMVFEMKIGGEYLVFDLIKEHNSIVEEASLFLDELMKKATNNPLPKGLNDLKDLN